MINHQFSLKNAFQEILYRIDNWINEGFSWIFELIESQYIDISTYRLLSGSLYVKMPAELRSSKQALINMNIMIKNIFFAVMLDILTPQKYRKNYTKG